MWYHLQPSEIQLSQLKSRSEKWLTDQIIENSTESKTIKKDNVQSQGFSGTSTPSINLGLNVLLLKIQLPTFLSIFEDSEYSDVAALGHRRVLAAIVKLVVVQPSLT